ncbi:MAG: N-acetylmuramoyl-L-alanine amidase family protein [Candidatus Dormibacteria bacterium]
MRSGPHRLLHILALALGLGAWSLFALTPAVAAAPAPKAPPAPYVVAIAPGHGGYDPGAVSPYNGLEEKNVTLSVGLDLKALLEAEGVKVVMSRTTDTYVSIAGMEAVAEDNHANVFVSLWVNDWSTASLEGVTVFTPHSWDTPFAQAIDQAMGKTIAPYGMGNRGIQPLPQLWVHATMPTVTIESGFMSNQKDSELLAEPGFRQQLAQGIYNGIMAFAPQIKTIHARQLAYQAAQARLAAARLKAARQGTFVTTVRGWAVVVGMTAILLFLALYRDTLGRAERWAYRRVRREVASRLSDALATSPRSERRVPAVRRRPVAPRRQEGRPARRQGRGAERWRVPGAATHPSRVVEMVHPDEPLRRRRERGSIYDDLPF